MQSVTKTMYCDVAVIGGGVGGCAAAVELARRGLHVIIFDKGVSLGGLATNGYVPQVAGHIEGICKEFVARLNEAGYVYYRVPGDDHNPAFDPEMGKFMLEQMIMEHNGRIIYDATCIDVEMDPYDPRRIEQAIFFTKGGLMSVKARYYVDATGDADVAAMAGVPYEVGSAQFAGLNMSTTMGSLWGGFNQKEFLEADAKHRAQQMEERGCTERETESILYTKETEAIARGELVHHIGNPYRGIFQVRLPGSTDTDMKFVTFSFHSYFTQNNDVENISRQVLEQHAMMRTYVKFLRENVPGYEKIQLLSTGSMPGVRDSRRIFGDYMLKERDIACGTKFDDGIARFPEMFDTHHPTSYDVIFQRHIHIDPNLPVGSAVTEEVLNSAENRISEEEQGSMIKGSYAFNIAKGSTCTAAMHPFVHPYGIVARSNPRDYCEIPYRSLLPRGIDNLLAVGRCCSAEFHANGAMRIIGPAMGTGQAAGTAIAMIADDDATIRDVDGVDVRKELIASGVALDTYPEGWWTILRDMPGKMVVNSGDAITIIPNE